MKGSNILNEYATIFAILICLKLLDNLLCFLIEDLDKRTFVRSVLGIILLAAVITALVVSVDTALAGCC